jgi:hypothetical protein
MSWTNKKLEKQAEKIFDKGIGSAARPGRHYLLLRPEASADSYFVERESRRMEKGDFLIPACSSQGDLPEAIEAHWAREESLRALAGDMGRLAEGLRKEGQQQTDEVSPFIYVMF